jgi:hypothetical protein
VMTVIASPGQGPDRSTEVSYTDTKVISNCLNLNYILLGFNCNNNFTHLHQLSDVLKLKYSSTT